MTFEEFQRQRGRNTSNEQDYAEYQQFLQQQGLVQNTKLAPKNIKKAASIKQLQATAPSLQGAPLVDGSGQQVGISNAAGNLTSRAQSILDAYRKDKVATNASLKSEDIDRSAKGLDLQKQKDAIEFPEYSNPSNNNLSFTGNTKGVMAAASMGMQAANANTEAQAIMGGAMTGLQVGSMLAGAAAGPVGWAVGAGTALMGLMAAADKKREQERLIKVEEEKQRKLEQQQKRIRELQLLQSQSQERSAAFQNLINSL